MGFMVFLGSCFPAALEAAEEEELSVEDVEDEELSRPARRRATVAKPSAGQAPKEPAAKPATPAGKASAPDAIAPLEAEPRDATARELFLEAHGDFLQKFRRFLPMIELSTLYMGKGSLNNESGEFQLLYYKLDALAPIPLNRDTFLVVGAHAGARDYDFKDVTGADDDVLYNAGLRLGVGHFFNDDLVAQAYWQPSLYSDLDGTLNSRDWKLWYGVALATYRVRDDLFLKAGVALTDAFDTGAVPVGGVSWLFHPEWRLDILLPRSAEVSWSPVRALSLQAGVEMEPEEFHIRFRTPQGEGETDVHVRDLRAYLGALYRFTDNLSAFVKAGTPVGGKYEWRDGSGQKYDGRLEPAFFVQGGLGWSF